MRYFASQASSCGSVRRQLMHEYVQKSTSTTLPRSFCIVSGVELIQCAAARERGRGAVVRQLRPAVGAVAGELRLAVELVRARRRFARCASAGSQSSSAREVCSFVSRLKTSAIAAARDHRAERPAQRERMRAQRRRDALSADRDAEQHDARAERVRDRERDRAEAEVHACGLRGDVREDRAAARHEREPERAAEQEAAVHVPAAPAAEPRERALDQLAELREEQCRRDDEEQRDRDVSQQVLRQAELVEQVRGEEDRDDERRQHPRDDRERTATAATRASGEDDRQDGQDARRDRRDHARQERDPEQYQHLVSYSVSEEDAGCYVLDAFVAASFAFAVAAAGFRRRRLPLLRRRCGLAGLCARSASPRPAAAEPAPARPGRLRLSSCACGAACGSAGASAAAGSLRARRRSPGSCRASRAPRRAAGSRAACSPRRRRGAPRRRQAVARAPC